MKFKVTAKTQKIIKASALGLLATAIAAAVLPNLFNLSKEIDHSPYAEPFVSAPDDEFRDAGNSGTIVLSNNRIRFEMDAATTHFTVTDLQSGEMYRSVPPGVQTASDEDKVRSGSEVALLYYDDQSKSKYMGSGPHSVDTGNYRILQKGNTIRVVYTFGTPGDLYFVPAAFEKDFYENSILPKITNATDLRRIKRYYRLYDPADRNEQFEEKLAYCPSIADRPMYVFSGNAEDKNVLKDITSYMETAGYTREQYEIDLQSIELEAGASAAATGFLVPVEYELTDSGFLARILTDRIEEYKEGDRIVTVSLLEYFNASSGEKTETYFVPDGSGALIQTVQSGGMNYSQTVFGEDESILSGNRSSIAQAVRLPVFGAYGNGKGFLAVIEGGAPQASVRATTRGTASPMNTLFCDFTIHSMMVTDIGTDRNIPIINLYSRHLIYETPTLRFSFAEPGKQDISGLAELYRDYLIGRGELSENIQSGNAPVYLDFTCLITKRVSILGISYNKKIVLSDFRSITEIVKKLQEAGITDLRIRLKGISDDGLAGGISDAFRISRRLGGKACLDALVQQVASGGGLVYFEGDFSQVYRDRSTDSFLAKSDAAYRLDRTLVRTGEYDTVTGAFDKSIFPGFALSPSEYGTAILSWLASFQRFSGANASGISWTDAGSRLYSDFNIKKDFDRAMTKSEIIAGTELLSRSGNSGFLTDGGNAYILKYASDLLSVPERASFYQIESGEVPFYQLVVNGRIRYASSPFNRSADPQDRFLRAVESGSSLYYDWIAGPDTLLKSTGYEARNYSLNYENSLEQLIGMESRLRELRQAVAGAAMVRYDKLADNVTLTTYSNGIQVLVNRSSTRFEFSGMAADGRDFAFFEGENG